MVVVQMEITDKVNEAGIFRITTNILSREDVRDIELEIAKNLERIIGSIISDTARQLEIKHIKKPIKKR